MATYFLQRVSFRFRLDPILEVRERPGLQRLAEPHQFARVPRTGRGVQQFRVDSEASEGGGNTTVEKAIDVIRGIEMPL